MSRKMAVLAVVAVAALACDREGEREPQAAVRNYIDKMVAAYRASNEEIVDPFVSEDLGRRLVGLIGVKRDAGTVLDAKLLDLEFTGVSKQGDAWVVETKERWYYADRKIGSGQQVGRDSTDSYVMSYRFVRIGGKLILDDLAFIGEPVVGRAAAAPKLDARIFHGTGATPDGGTPATAPESNTTRVAPHR